MSTKNPPHLSISIADDLQRKIKDEAVYSYGDRLPNETWLCNQYNASRTTIRRALDLLISQGFLERIPNRGVYVSFSKFSKSPSQPYSLFNALVKDGYRPRSTILSFSKQVASAAFAGAMDIKKDTPLLEIYRLRYANDVPFNLQYIYLLEDYFPKFNPWSLIDNSLYDIITTQYGLSFSKTVQNVTAVAAKKEQASLLNIPIQAPLLYTTGRMYSTSGELLLLQKNYILCDVIPYNHRIGW